MGTMGAVTIFMLILIGLGVAAAIVGVTYAVLKGWRLYRAVRTVQRRFDAELEVLTEKQELAMQRAEKIQTEQVLLQTRVAELQEALRKVSLLTRELTAARTRLNLLG